jgi:hypothetical protein
VSARHATARPVRPVHIHIEELRLAGFDPRQRYRIADALERELARLLNARSGDHVFAPPGQTASVDAGTFSFRTDASPEQIGAEIARAAFRGITGAAQQQPGPEPDNKSWHRADMPR